MDQKRIIVVLGMHRSGTSALTRGLEALGIGLGDQLNPANFANPKGYWEDEDIMALNEAILHRLGSSYHGLGLIGSQQLRTDDFADLRQQGFAILSRKLQGGNVWAFKDPRTPRLLPFWQTVFADMDLQASYLISVRNPISVAQSLLKRDSFAPVKSYYLWLEHLLGALVDTESKPRAVVDYDTLLTQPAIELHRISQALQLPKPSPESVRAYAEDFLDSSLRHTRHSFEELLADEDMPGTVVRLYTLLQKMATNEQSLSAAEVHTEVLAIMAEWRQLRPLLAYVGEVDTKITSQVLASQKNLHYLQVKCQSYQTSVDIYENDLDLYEKQAGVYAKDIANYQRQVTSLGAKAHRLSLEVKQLANENQELISDRDTIKRRMDDITNSRSWRLISGIQPQVAILRARKRLRFPKFLLGSRKNLPDGFDEAYYLRNNPDVAKAGIDPVKHYLTSGKAEGRAFSAKMKSLRVDDFDPKYYLANNPDVASSGIDPLQHYLEYGKAEGRLPKGLTFENDERFSRLDTTRETVLLVGHEASRTGAPVLTLNIAQALHKKYNVVIMLLGPGPLVEDMTDAGAIVLGPFPSLRGDARQAGPIIAALSQTSPIKFAITNSIIAAAILPQLFRHGIPTVALIHEFASYTRPRGAFMNAALWANSLVFSARLTMENALQEAPCLSTCSLSIIPQGRCRVPDEHVKHDSDPNEAIELRQRIRGNVDVEGGVVVLGLGTVQIRKGVDLFVACAERIVRRDPTTKYRFVWIGSGFDPEDDLQYSVYLSDQISRSGLGDRFDILKETPHIETAYASADVLVLSSRLDPLPNVAIDAMSHGLPLVCFDDTTGIADVLREANLVDQCVAPYLDVDDMAQKVTAIASSAEYRAQLGTQLRNVVATRFQMDTYVDQLERLAIEQIRISSHEQQMAKDLGAYSLLDASFLLPPELAYLGQNDAAAFYIRGWKTGVRWRKPFPGFHPGMYRDAHPGIPDDTEPLLHYLQNGRPTGSWLSEVITDKDPVLPIAATARTALHIHVYYADLLVPMVEALQQNRVRPDLFISVPSANVAEEAASILESYAGKIGRITIVPNRGRDIGPLLTEFGAELVANYELVGHLHTKKTTALADSSVGRIWSKFLVQNLLGGSTTMADRILGRMTADPSIGLVFPDDPNICGWESNRIYAESLAQRLGIPSLPEQFNFPVGTMFWAKTEALRPFVELGMKWTDYPAEPLGYDGSILHALERMFPLAVAHAGLRVVVTHCTDVGR